MKKIIFLVLVCATIVMTGCKSAPVKVEAKEVPTAQINYNSEVEEAPAAKINYN